jgi:nucleoside-diphosphate-sugar epimerase
MNWNSKKVLVTGGASFIGSHLTEQLLALNAQVRVADNFSSGERKHLESLDCEVLEGDLLEPAFCDRSTKGMDVVFHLAADHGGRGYIDAHQVECSTNMILDGQVFRSAHRNGVEKIVFASSGCVYPTSAQMDVTKEVFLHEDMVTPPYEADDLYGWAKLMAELTLKAYHQQHGLQTTSCRYFTVYGPRCTENHAVMAMIARGYLKLDPFEVWGNGEQIRNWTHVDDIVSGTIAAAEKIHDGTSVNLGTMERIKVKDCAKQVIDTLNPGASIKLLLDKPTGPLNRVASNALAKELLGWSPQTIFTEGLQKTIDWYVHSKTTEQASSDLSRKLVGR